MDAIKLETELNLETIFTSITFDNLSKLNDLLAIKEIDLQEKADINKYIYLSKQTGNVPNIEILKKEFPNLYFETYQILTKDELNDYVKLYISKKKNLALSKELMELSASVRYNGLNETIINKLNNLTKSDVVEIAHKDIEDRILDVYNNKISMNGIKTGVKAVDSDTGGLQPGSLCTILGFTGSFKTTWALNIAYNAKCSGKNVLYLSLEVTQEHIYYNLLSRHSFNSDYNKHIEHLALKHKELDDDEYNILHSRIYPDFKALGGKVYIVDETELETYSFFSLENKFSEIDKRAVAETGHGIDLLVVDHAQLLKFDSSMKGIGNETNVVNAYVSFFRQCALNWIKSGKQISVLILSQSSREGWKEAVRSEGRYRLTALAEANELERASSLVLSVFSSDSLKQVKAAKVQILKNRDGQVWSEPMEVFVDPVYYVFGDVTGAIETTGEFNLDNMNSLFDTEDSNMNNLLNSINIDDLDLDVN